MLKASPVEISTWLINQAELESNLTKLAITVYELSQKESDKLEVKKHLYNMDLLTTAAKAVQDYIKN